MGEYTIRDATCENDVALLTALESACFADPWREGEIRSHLGGASAVSMLCLNQEGDAVGYLFGSCLPPEGEVFRIGVLPQRRGGGIGRIIMSSFLDLLTRLNADVCFLEVRESNAAARALYASVGFETVGLRKNYYKNPTEHALVMRRG